MTSTSDDPSARYLTPVTLRMLVARDRLRPVLVRMDRCRFTAPAQDVQHIIDALEEAGDHCRDAQVTA